MLANRLDWEVEMKLGILTVGSDAPGLNAVIRAVVRAGVTHRSDVFGISQGFVGLLQPPQLWPLSLADVNGLVRRGGTILGCNRESPFDQPEGDRSAEVLESIRWLGLDAVICVGGAGTLAIARRLFDLGAPVVCVPKSVENDLCGTETTFGTATAVDLATAAIDTLQTTSEAEHRTMVLEVTGRSAGWIALAAGIAGGADVLLIPEIPYDPQRVLAVIGERRSRRKRSTIVVVAEGARPIGTPPAEGRPEGTAARQLGELLGDEEHRISVLGPLQRGGDPGAHDRILATRLGVAAVRAAHEGALGSMVGLRGEEAVFTPLREVTGRLRTIDPAGEWVAAAKALGLSMGV